MSSPYGTAVTPRICIAVLVVECNQGSFQTK